MGRRWDSIFSEFFGRWPSEGVSPTSCFDFLVLIVLQHVNLEHVFAVSQIGMEWQNRWLSMNGHLVNSPALSSMLGTSETIDVFSIWMLEIVEDIRWNSFLAKCPKCKFSKSHRRHTSDVDGLSRIFPFFPAGFELCSPFPPDFVI